jgi:hypothetical protein
MNRFAAWGLSAALAAGAAPAFAADPPQPDAKPSWFGRMLGKSEKKPDQDRTFADLPARPPVVVGPLEPLAQADALRAEQDAYLRRLDVCLKLREIAAAKGDERLLAQADELEKQATALYHQRVARLGVKAQIRTPAETLDRSTTATTATTAPPQPERKFREVKQ